MATRRLSGNRRGNQWGDVETVLLILLLPVSPTALLRAVGTDLGKIALGGEDLIR